MKPILNSFNFNLSTRKGFLSRADSKFTEDWKLKFPYASNRFGQFSASHKELLPCERTASASSYNPTLYDGVKSAPSTNTLLMSGISMSHGGVKSDKVEKVNLADLEVRMVQSSLKKIYDEVDKPDAESDFTLRYNTYLNKVSHFFKAAEN